VGRWQLLAGLTRVGSWQPLTTQERDGAACEASWAQPQSKGEAAALPTLRAMPRAPCHRAGQRQRFPAPREETGHQRELAPHAAFSL